VERKSGKKEWQERVKIKIERKRRNQLGWKEQTKSNARGNIQLHLPTCIQPINFPTVPVGTERLRITPSPAHSPEDIDYLIDSLCTIWDTLGLPRSRACPALILDHAPFPENQYLPKVEFLNHEPDVHSEQS
jgi:hypothetical protein